ncbi:glycosyl hydrolase [Pseudactinotalea suaedae]|uniref:glycosyl hydrolase n=1 Tax=Pseudactinotalea suaedae TaxID=1524924 RepID=UPI0012E27CD3|nr:glycosyl hydrolase [Pseudactinotalea suaedae]
MSDTVTADQLRAALREDHPDAAPMMRWWWFGPALERAELDRELAAMAAAGIGGVEVSFVYPLEAATTTFCSPEMLADLRWAAERAHELGLRFDVTLGSGWSYGGPHITAELAARGLRWDRHEIAGGAHTLEVAPAWPGDELVAAYLAPGSVQEQSPGAQQVDVQDAGGSWQVTVPEGSGTRHVLLAWSRLTGQQVKRAAAGAEGPVLDHYSARATLAHLHAVGDPMLDAVPAELLGSVFCDSLEVYHADWTPDLVEQFEQRRGYPLLPALPRLLQAQGEAAHRLRADYHRTLVDLYEERFVSVVRDWARGRGVPFRLQGYGTPPATLSSYRFADLFEGEGWGWTELTATRWASSAAHHYGRDVVSAEAWTWVHSPSFRATPLDLVAEAHEHLLNGVTLLIGHGWPYSPSDAPGLGWFFYAAGCLDDRNPWWPAMPAVTAHLTRLSWLLRQGVGVADVAVYVPTQDLLARSAAGIGGSVDAWREANRTVTADVLGPIRRAGLDYRLFDDDVVVHTDLEPPAVILVPQTRMLPDATRAWLEDAARAGSTVLTIDSAVSPSGSCAVSTAELASALRVAVAAPYGETESEIGLVHRRVDGLDVRMLANTTSTPAQVTVAIDGAWQRWDPATAEVTGSGTGPAAVEVAPYEATILVSGTGVDAVPVAEPQTAEVVRLAEGWQCAFADAAAEPVALPHRWEDQPGRGGYSGSATYTVTVDLADQAEGGRAVLDLGAATSLADGRSPQRGMVGPAYHAALRGPVGEVAVVRVNDRDCGVAFGPPYRVDVSDAVRPGPNTIEITVHNTAANALAHDPEIGALVERTEARYGRRFVMQELDRALEGVASGLLDVPSLELSPARSSGSRA